MITDLESSSLYSQLKPPNGVDTPVILATYVTSYNIETHMRKNFNYKKVRETAGEKPTVSLYLSYQ